MTIEKQAPTGRMKVLGSFTLEERATLAQIKRFLEWLQGDPAFGGCLRQGSCPPETLDRLKRIGVDFAPEELAPFWRKSEFLNQVGCDLSAACRSGTAAETLAEVRAQYPLVDLWLRYLERRIQIYHSIPERIVPVPLHPVFDAWRKRRIASTRSELGYFGHYIDHPILAFELGDGCSIGCWFCGFATRKLTQNFDYAEGAPLFRAMAQVCVNLFGAREAGLALLYYGTEPHDNPHYLDFVKDYAQITGCKVCTSTAVVTDAPWLRELLAFYREHNLPWPRLSVLSKSLLMKIHDLYSPDELRSVELLMQMRDHARPKVTSGRLLAEQSGFRGQEHPPEIGRPGCDCFIPQGSIACVSGFLINMVQRTIQLISPCYTSARWPHGYRVFAESRFTDAEDFRSALETLIAANMPSAPPPDRLACFRDDLVYGTAEGGFELTSPNQFHHCRGNAVYCATGALLAERRWTYEQLIDRVAERYPGADLEVVAILKTLYDDGFLDEVGGDSVPAVGAVGTDHARSAPEPA